MGHTRRAHRIIAAGRSHAIAANRARIEREVRARHARDFQTAGMLRRVAIWIRIRLEIERELEKIAPHGGTYGTN
jgi:hypothetical protein